MYYNTITYHAYFCIPGNFPFAYEAAGNSTYLTNLKDSAYLNRCNDLFFYFR